MARAPKYSMKRNWGWMTNIVVRKKSRNLAPKPAFAILRGLGRPSLLAASALGTVLLVTPAVVKKAHAQVTEPINSMPYTNTATDGDGTTYIVLPDEDCNLSATCIDIETGSNVDDSFISLKFDDTASSQLDSTENGIVIETYSDNVDVTIENESSTSHIDVDGFGIVVVGGEDQGGNISFLGDVNITWDGDIDAGNVGVFVHDVGYGGSGNIGSTEASVTINVNDVTTDINGDDAIHVGNVWGGPVDVNVAGNLNTQGGYAEGVFIHDVAGDVYVEVLGEINTDGDDADGVQVGNVFSIGGTDGNVTIEVGDITTDGENADGVEVYGVYGIVDVTVDGNITARGDNASGINIDGEIYMGGNTYTTVTDSVIVSVGDISTAGIESEGVNIDDIEGSVDVTAGNITTNGYDSAGVEIDTIGGGVSVVTGDIETSGDRSEGITIDDVYSGLIDVDVNGDIETNGNLAFGVEVDEVRVDQIDITVTGNIETQAIGSHGVFVHEAYADNPDDGILINVNNIETSGDESDGINITGNIGADMTVNVSGDILVTGDGSAGVRVGLDVNDIDSKDDFDNIYETFGEVVGNVSLNIDEGASIYSEAEGFPVTNGAIVVATIGDITVNNSGNLGASNGFTATLIALGDEFDDPNDLFSQENIVFNNEDSGVFNGGMLAIALPDYDDGNIAGLGGSIEINNDGLWDAEGPSFLVGKDVQINNDGIFEVTGEYEQTVTIFAASLEGKDAGYGAEFYNDGVVTLADGDPTDELELVGKDLNDDYETDFDWRGGPGSTLVLDAYLAGPYDSEADELYIDGDTSGTTEIVIYDVEPSSPGAYNPEGILLVTVTGYSELGDFVLADGPINKGLFQYDLYLTEDGYDYEWVLASIPGQAAQEAPSIVTGLEELGHQAMAAGTNRLGLLGDCSASYRPGVNPTADAAGCDDMGGSVWMSVLGRGMNVDGDNSFGLYGQTTDFDVSYDQVMWGLIAGADGGRTWTDSHGHLSSVYGGVLGGYLATTMDFESGNEASYDGGMAGIYGGYQSGAWFLNSVLTGMFGSMSFDSGSLAAWGGAEDAGVFQVGGVVDSGFRFGAERGMTGIFFEPGVTVSVLSTSVDDAEWAGNDMSFDDSTSFRGRVGAKVGMETEGGFNAYVEASLWNEFGDDPEITISSLNAPDVSVTGNGLGMWADIGLGIGYETEHFAFGAEGDVAYNEDMMSYGGSVKLQVSW
jgi:putative surface-exposed virulence protein